MSSGVRELRVWQESVALAGDVIRAARQGMRRETQVVSDAFMVTAVCVATHIADGYGRHGANEQRESYLAAKRALLQLETELAVARHCDLIPSGSFSELTARSAQVSRLLAGYLAYLDRLVAEGASVPSVEGSHVGSGIVAARRETVPVTLGSSHVLG